MFETGSPYPLTGPTRYVTDFEELGPLGRGGYGEVFRVRHHVDGRTYAVKKVPIPARGVDYRGKVVLAPMVRSGELPSRLLALHYGADLVWSRLTLMNSLKDAC